MNNNFSIPNLLHSVATQMRAALRQNLIPHPGELGTGREEVIRDFLRRHLPKRFGVSTGFVFDVHGNVSRQIDVIIYDAFICPSFEAVGGKLFFPCEAVVCVGEVKSTLNSKRDIHKAFNNILSVRTLDRSAGGKNYAHPDGESINQTTNYLDQIFTFIFVIDHCVREETMRECIFEYIYQNERHLWLNICFFFDHFLLTYCCEGGICPNPMDALAITSMRDLPSEILLARFYLMIARAIEVTTVSSFSYWDYLPDSSDWEADAYYLDEHSTTTILPDHILNRITSNGDD